MLANCCAVSPVSFRMVGARAAKIVRWKKESHEHAAMAKHGTPICHVTDGPAAAAAVAVTVFTPVVVDINFSSGLRYFLDLSGTGGSYHGLGHCSAVDHLIERNRKRRAAGGCSGKGFQCDAPGGEGLRLRYLVTTFRPVNPQRPPSP